MAMFKGQTFLFSALFLANICFR